MSVEDVLKMFRFKFEGLFHPHVIYHSLVDYLTTFVLVYMANSRRIFRSIP